MYGKIHKSFLKCTPQLSGASTPCFPILHRPRVYHWGCGYGGWWFDGWHSVSILSSLSTHHLGQLKWGNLMVATSFVYWYGRQHFLFTDCLLYFWEKLGGERRARVQGDPERGISPWEFSKEVGIFGGVSETGVSTHNIENYCHGVTAFFDFTSTFQR